MIERVRPKAKESGGYFQASDRPHFIPSGCTVLDCVLGGGYPLGRIVNIIGDKATGKTLLAIEACANFARSYPNGRIWYREAEAAFDLAYAESLGMPLDRINFATEMQKPILTVEDVFEDLTRVLSKTTKNPGLYILDSLDALSDRAELDRDIDKGSFGAAKAKKMSELFRRLVQKLGDHSICVMIISQVRDNIGVTFGRKTTRSGGRALDFYASQVLYLAQKTTLTKTRHGVTRSTGVIVKVKCDKNKIGLPFRDCSFPILFGYGIDDVTADLEWLAQVNALEDAGLNAKTAADISKRRFTMPRSELADLRKRLRKAVRSVWREIDNEFVPKVGKYARA